jgi:SET domain
MRLTRRREQVMTDSGPPHKNVFTRLKPSEYGVGVFAIQDIKKGTLIFPGEELVGVDMKEVELLSGELRKLYEDFGVKKGGKYWCPANFNCLTVSWYLRDSESPNVTVDSEYNMTAKTDITEGEELTADYTTYSEESRLPWRRPLGARS